VQAYKQFGNSVSVPVIRALAKEIAIALESNDYQ
jgi:site-specific DNA-cytosine methylase